MSSADLSGTKLVVTGADGFIGSHLVEHLVTLGADVRAFCYYNSNGSHGWLDESDLRNEVEFVLGDVRDADSVDDAVKGCEMVFHLAALIAIPYSYRAPDSYVETNIRGTLNVLQAAVRHGVARMVHTSTSEVYGTPDEVPITESHPLKGQSPYSASKIGADKMVEAFYASFKTPVVTLRPFNTYGPRQSTRAVIPTVLSQLLAGKEEIAIGSLEPQRDFTYVTDTVRGLTAAGTAGDVEGEVIQLGTGSTISIGDLVEMAIAVTGSGARVRSEKERQRPPDSEVMVLLSDPSRARKLLNWQHEVEVCEGLELTADWVKSHLELFDVDRFHV